MRSQFPRHIVLWRLSKLAIGVSISDEKPVPSPLPLIKAVPSFWAVSISDEKPVPSPRLVGQIVLWRLSSFNLR